MSDMPKEKSGNFEIPANLTEYFHRELIKNLSELNSIISIQQNKRLSKKAFIKAGAILEDIHDLSMVHGFDSIEAIAEKLVASTLRQNSDAVSDVDTTLNNVRSGIRAIIDILRISIELPDEAGTSSARTSQKDSRADRKPAEQFFDIKEIDSLMKLIEEQQASTVNEMASTGPTGLKLAFDEVFREEAQESLSQFEIAIENLKSGNMTTENLLRLKSAVFNLHDASRSYSVDILNDALGKLIEFCENDLKIGLGITARQIYILENCRKMLHAFVTAFPEREFSQPAFFQIFNAEFEKLETKVPAETEPNSNLHELSPQIRVKVSLTKEEIRRRWILKKH